MLRHISSGAIIDLCTPVTTVAIGASPSSASAGGGGSLADTLDVQIDEDSPRDRTT
jgi:hypothetical protein